MSELVAGFVATWRHPEFRRGAREMVGIAMGIAAWGLVTGMTMAKSGLGVPLSVAMSLLVFAGSSQLAALPLIANGAPIWVVWATAACVNLRFVIFSAQWRPYFMRFPRAQRVALGYFSADLTYVSFMRRFDEPRDDEGQVEYFLGGAALSWCAWQIPSVVGILLAESIPTHWGLGFAGVLALLGMLYSLLGDRTTVLAAVMAGGAAVAAFALPFRLHIVVAIAAAVCLGLLLEAGAPAPARSRRADTERQSDEATT